MKRDDRLVRLSWDHHHGLVMALRIAKELPTATEDATAKLYSDLLAFWTAGLLPHFRVEGECLLARLVRHVPHHHETIERTNRDHLDMAALVASMRDTSDPPSRRQLLADFGARLHDHIRWEEQVLFQVTQEQLTEPEMDALGEEVEQALPNLEAAPQN
jgi:hemerythrin-like domain-containing protein